MFVLHFMRSPHRYLVTLNDNGSEIIQLRLTENEAKDVAADIKANSLSMAVLDIYDTKFEVFRDQSSWAARKFLGSTSVSSPKC